MMFTLPNSRSPSGAFASHSSTDKPVLGWGVSEVGAARLWGGRAEAICFQVSGARRSYSRRDELEAVDDVVLTRESVCLAGTAKVNTEHRVGNLSQSVRALKFPKASKGATVASCCHGLVVHPGLRLLSSYPPSNLGTSKP